VAVKDSRMMPEIQPKMAPAGFSYFINTSHLRMSCGVLILGAAGFTLLIK
jgi:hypothetical protein